MGTLLDAETALATLREHGFETPGRPQPESRFIPGTERCPSPHYWHSTDGDSTEIEVSEMIGGLVRGLQPDVCVETGAAFGQTSEQIGKALKRSRHGRLFACEPDELRVPIARRRCRNLPVSILAVASLDLNLMRETRLEFLFCDSTIELRVPEFLHFRRWMPAGSMVVFHDSREGHRLREEIERRLVRPGLVRAVDLSTPRGLTVCEVLK